MSLSTLELPAPSPRLLRTRSAAPPSPLSRKPLGRGILIGAFALTIVRCGSEPEWTGVNISASEDWKDATVTIGNHQVGKLEPLMLHGSAWEEQLKRQYGDTPAFHAVALNVSIDASKSRHGIHRIRIEKPGRTPVEGEFTFPDPRGSRVQFLSISGQSLEIIPGPDAHGNHP